MTLKHHQNIIFNVVFLFLSTYFLGLQDVYIWSVFSFVLLEVSYYARLMYSSEEKYSKMIRRTKIVFLNIKIIEICLPSISCSGLHFQCPVADSQKILYTSDLKLVNPISSRPSTILFLSVWMLPFASNDCQFCIWVVYYTLCIV